MYKDDEFSYESSAMETRVGDNLKSVGISRETSDYKGAMVGPSANEL